SSPRSRLGLLTGPGGERVRHLLDRDPELVGQVRRELVAPRLHLRLELQADLLERRRHVRGLHAQRLGEVIREGGRRTDSEAAGAEAWAWRTAARRTVAVEEPQASVSARRAGKRVGAAHRPGRANLFERGSQLVP